MRHRVPVVLAAVMASIGLLAPAAFAGPDPLPAASCKVGTLSGPYHIVTNANTSVGITYHGIGNQATVTSSPGDSYLVVAECQTPTSPPVAYVIRNASGNCLRMHDKSSGYAVFEEDGCELGNLSEQFDRIPNNINSNLYIFFNNGYYPGQALGVNCPPSNGDKIFGVPYLASGTCQNWLQKTP